MRSAFSILLLIVFCVSQSAYSEQGKSVEIKNASIRLMPKGVQSTSGYFKLKNISQLPVTLVGGEASFSKSVELHTHKEVNGMHQMVQMEKVVVPPLGEIEFKPGADHLMFIGLKGVLKEKGIVQFYLKFEDQSKTQVKAAVTREPGAMDHKNHHH